MIHNSIRSSLVALGCLVASIMPAGALTLDQYLNPGVAGGAFNQDLTYSGSNGNTFTDGNLQFTFTGLSITPTCYDNGSPVACASGSYHPITANGLTVAPTDPLVGMDGFDLSGQAQVSSYLATDGHQIDVTEDINLNYSVTSLTGPTITDAHLDAGGCVNNGTGCVSSGNGLPPKFQINENFYSLPSGSSLPGIAVFAPPPILNAWVDFVHGTSSNGQTFTPVSSQTALRVTKDIFLDSGTCANCSVSMSDIKQYYSQQVVPEPRAYAFLLAFGLLGFATLRNRLTAKA